MAVSVGLSNSYTTKKIMTKNKIKDIPRYKKLENNIEGAKALQKLFNFAHLFGYKNKEIEKVFANFNDLEKQTISLINLPDMFNEKFGDMGWIAFESMDSILMEEAISIAKKKDLESAEIYLADYYTEEKLNWKLKQFLALPEFEARYDLFELTIKDYLEKRYYACVPLLLLIMDGFVNEVEEKGFFAKNVDLNAWDSIAAHSSGLQKLSVLFNKSRKKTTTESLTIPYRHGIMHGRDVNFNNKIVAAKCLFAIFAIRDWVLAIKNGQKEQPIPEPPKTFMELIKQYKQSKDLQKKLDSWVARKIVVGKNIPSKGKQNDYSENSPERTLVEYFEYWMKENYGYMSKISERMSGKQINEAAKFMRDQYSDFELIDFEIVSVTDNAPVISTVNTITKIKCNNKVYDTTSEIRLIFQTMDRSIIIRGENGGKWYVQDWSINVV